MPTQFISPPTMPPTNGWSQVVVAEAGKTIYLSGQVSVNEKGEVVGKGDMKAQAEQVFANLNAGLAAAGATFNDVVKMNQYVVGLQPEHLPIVREVRSRYINMQKPPASTLVGVPALAVTDWLIEVEVVAVLAG